MVDLGATYEQLAQPWSRERLAAAYGDANRRGKQRVDLDPLPTPVLPVAILAAAIPPLTSLSVAINVLHVLPNSIDDPLPDHLLAMIEGSAADVLHRCHHALELDGVDHGYTADQWLPTVCDVAGPLLQSSTVDQEPPPAVHHTQDAVNWVARALIDLEQESPDSPAAIADALGRLLVTFLFAQIADDVQSR